MIFDPVFDDAGPERFVAWRSFPCSVSPPARSSPSDDCRSTHSPLTGRTGNSRPIR
jgi:hypothetical protein